MSYNRTTFFCGIYIKTWTLMVADHAFRKIYPLLLALKLHSMNIKPQGLKMDESVSERTNFGDLPVDVLKIIRKKIFESTSMENSASEVFEKELYCKYRDDAPTEADFGWGEEKLDRSEHNFLSEGNWTAFVSSYRCDSCFYNEDQKQQNPIDRKVSIFFAIRNSKFRVETLLLFKADQFLQYLLLLDYYGLFIEFGPEEEYLASMFLAISVGLYAPFIFNETASHDGSDESNAMSSTILREFSTSSFDIHFDRAAARFNRLIKDWDLVVHDNSLEKRADPTENDSGVVEETIEGELEVKK